MLGFPLRCDETDEFRHKMNRLERGADLYREVEGLIAAVKDATGKGFFNRVPLPNNGLLISSLHYADDAIFLGRGVRIMCKIVTGFTMSNDWILDWESGYFIPLCMFCSLRFPTVVSEPLPKPNRSDSIFRKPNVTTIDGGTAAVSRSDLQADRRRTEPPAGYTTVCGDRRLTPIEPPAAPPYVVAASAVEGNHHRTTDCGGGGVDDNHSRW
ncbi:hypothetical protein OSB04_002342 [Centaurea solstitialis]|uniref:Uncharacterized protein n=1 Tax=Centaurea solstitialis TaxID=347529 RepID=A0AA38WVA4_9ASTR|nr:hypothetical protein OSB04_002342 [Centaurea solstitialis]